MAGSQLLPTRLALLSSLLLVKVELVVTWKNQATLWKCTLVYDLALTARCRVRSSVVDHKVVPIKISLRSKNIALSFTANGLLVRGGQTRQAGCPACGTAARGQLASRAQGVLRLPALKIYVGSRHVHVAYIMPS